MKKISLPAKRFNKPNDKDSKEQPKLPIASPRQLDTSIASSSIPAVPLGTPVRKNQQESPTDEEFENIEPAEIVNDVEKPNKKILTKHNSEEDSAFFRFTRKHPVLFVLIVTGILIAIILSIVLPLTLIKKVEEKPVTPRCPDGKVQPRVDCLPDKKYLLEKGQNLESVCKSRACCWAAGSDGPNCAYPYNYGFRTYKVKENTVTSKWNELTRMNSPVSAARSDISNLEIKIEMQTDQRMRIRIYPRRNFKNKLQRWEIPSGIRGENVFKPNYRIETTDLPYSIKIIRQSTNRTIFDTSLSSLIFSDQFIQLTTRLSSSYVFGIGEHSKDNFLHDMNYKTWPLFSSDNHPKTANERPNLYSQLPMYLNIEPEGTSNLVVFYNSNPSEFYLTPYPSLTFRSIGGILDIYIFTGPTPVQAIEQYQQAFGLPKLPPFWSLGLQIGAKKFSNMHHLRYFIDKFKNTSLPFDSVMVGYEHMSNANMFTLSPDFHELNDIVDGLRNENRATVLQILAAIVNTTQNYPFSEGVSREKYWILENFFSSGVVGHLLGRNVVYPDFTMDKTKDWWRDALQRFIVTDGVIKFDGIFLDYLTPLDENLNKTCPNNKWNNPSYLPDSIARPLYNGTLCMDSRYENGRHFNIHGLYSHYAIEATARAFDSLLHNRTLIMSRHAFLGTGQYSAKWLGEYDHQWDDFRRSIVATVEMNMFGFVMTGADLCGYNENINFDMELCENWIRASAMSPLMKMSVESGNEDDEKYNILTKNGMFEVLNSSLHLRYSLIPYFYTQLYKATKFGTVPIRPLAFEFPTDVRTYKIDNQWLWGDKLMVSVGNTPGGLTSAYLPRGRWFDYYRGFQRESMGEYANVQLRRNETSLHIRAGSVIFKQDCNRTAVDSKNTYVDVIIALNEDTNFTAFGELYTDDPTKKNTEKKDNYHRLIQFNVYRKDDDGIIEVKRVSGRYLTKLSYRDLIIMGLRSKPKRITVNENSQAVDGSKCVWDDVNMVYYVNLQTEIKRKVLLDTEYLSFRWTEGFEQTRQNNGNNNNNQNINPRQSMFGF